MGNVITRLAVLLTLSALLSGTTARESFAQGGPKLPENVTARTLDGKTVSLDAHRGKLILLTVWRTDCPPCLMEIPSLNKLHEEFADEGVSIIGLSMDRDKDELVQKVIEKREIAYPVWLGHGQPISIYFATDFFPTLFVISPDGDVLGYLFGALVPYDYALAVLKEARALAGERKGSQ